VDNLKSDETLAACYGSKVIAAYLEEAGICIKLEGSGPIKSYTLTIADCGQDCCESRYITCDDDLASMSGEVLIAVETAETPYDWGDHEVQFLVVRTDKATYTAETHNEHNGYYGGFRIRAYI